MDADAILRISREALMLVLTLSAPIVLAALVVGLIVSLLQAATQLQEQTLSFVPKLIAVAIAISLFGCWMLDQLGRFATSVFQRIAGVSG